MSQRNEILAAIEKLERQRSTLGDATVDAAVTGLRQQLERLSEDQAERPRDEAERKQITVMFADLSGFTPLSGRLDPEELRSLVNSCFDSIGGVVTRLGGYIDKFIGDEMMVLFGAPVAMEDHASRALFAAVEVRNALADFNQRHPLLREQPLALHFGINSGMVVAGMVGTDARQEYTVMGEPVNIAARLVSAAEAGQILVGDGTHRLIGEGFGLKDLGEMDLKGVSGGTRVWELISVSQPSQQRRPQRFAAPMIGRDEQMAQMQRQFRAVADDRAPRSVALVGPAGIGKSRLHTEFREWVEMNHPDAITLHGAAFPHMQATPYYMIGDLLRHWLGTLEGEGAADIKERLSAAVARLGFTDPGLSDALSRLMGIESESDSLSALEPNERKERIFDCFLNLVRALSASGPLVLAFEDLHWTDDLSMELLEHLFTGLEGSPVLFLTMTRPVLDPDATIRQVEARIPVGRHTRVTLAELGEETCAQLVQKLAPGLGSSPELVSAIVQKGQGNPFFVEEIVGALRDRGLDVETARSIDASELAVPDTVFGLLSERIDRLPQAEKRVLQSAAVVGRVFWPALVSELTEMEPDAQLDSLNRRDFIHPVGTSTFGEDLEWMFRHVLLQEVAYSGLLKERRKFLHEIAARWLEERVGDRRGEYAPLLAHHYELAEDWPKAAEWAEVAAERAADIFAHREARLSYLKAIDALAQMEQTEDIKRRLIDVTLKLTNVSFYWATEELYRTLEQAKQLAEEIGDTTRLIQTQSAMSSWLYMTGQGRRAVETAMQCAATANTAGLESLLVVPYQIIGRAFFVLGQYARCAEFLEKSRALADATGQDMDALTAGWRAGAGKGFLGMTYQLLGQHAKGRALSLESLRTLEAKADTPRVGVAHVYLGVPAVLFGRLDEAGEHLTKALEIADAIGDVSLAYTARGFLGYWHLQHGRVDESVACNEQALAEAAEVESTLFVPILEAYAAAALVRANRSEEGLALAERAVADARATQQFAQEGETHLMLGWTLNYTRPEDHDAAEREIRQSVAIHEQCGNLIMLARDLYDLAAFLRIVGKEDAANEAESRAEALKKDLHLDWLPMPHPAGPPA